jgi:hypothetical protein
MLKLLVLVLSVTCCFAQHLPIPALDFAPEKYICYRAEGGITVDGKLDEVSWERAEWTADFVDIEGELKPAPRFCTRAKMLWDETNFYIAAKLEEPDIWGTLQNRDDIIFYDNDFEVFIDPDGNTRGYAEFEMNALNTIWDLFLIMPYRDIDQAAVHGWDIKGIASGVHVDGTLNKPGDQDNFWTVEIAFPFAAFGEIAQVAIPPQDGDQWRVNFSRVEWKTEVTDGVYQKQVNPATNKPYPEDNWVWSPQGVVNMHYPEMWGYVQFSNQITGSEEVAFKERPEEAAKWFLRQLYYRQKNYHQKTGMFSAGLEQLQIEFKPLGGFSTKPVIERTTNLYEAYLQADDGTSRIYIDHSGLTWITQSNDN